jgi:hypothetical protein
MRSIGSFYLLFSPLISANKANRRFMNPVRTANNFGVEEIIDPAETRPMLAMWVKHIYEELMPERIMNRANGKICPVFY